MVRDKQIDVLRFLGIALIILAHLDVPRWLYQLRNFDVPLIMLASGMALRQTGFKGSYADYLWKRVKRLVFPSWLFLTGYFLVLGVTGLPLERLTFDHILESYLFLSGADFVWIIRVFL